MRLLPPCTVACLCYMLLSAPHLVPQDAPSFFPTTELSRRPTAYAYEQFLSSTANSSPTGDYLNNLDVVQFFRQLPLESSTRVTVDPNLPTTWYSGASAILELGIYGDAIAKLSSDNPLWIPPGSLGDTNLWAYVRQEDDSPVPRVAFEFVGEEGLTRMAKTDFYYEYDFSNLGRIEITVPSEQEHVASWTPPASAAPQVRAITEWLRENYGTPKVRAPCMTCRGVAGGAFYGDIGPSSLAMPKDAFGPDGDVSVSASASASASAGAVSSTEAWVTYSNESLGQVTSTRDYRVFEETRKNQIDVGKKRSESMIDEIVAKLEGQSEALGLEIFAAWEFEQKPRHDCGTYYCMTSLQVIVPREIVLGHSEEEMWATFDITLLFTIRDLRSISRAQLMVDAYADVKRSGRKMPPLAEGIFRCPPLAKDKRNYERNIAEVIEGWI